MKCLVLSGVAILATAHASAGMACGLFGAPIRVGTPIQEVTFPNRARPTMGFGAMQSAVTRASVVFPPCHGTLTVTHPLGFLYAPAPGFVGQDTWAVQGCLANGRCDVTGAVVTVTP